MLSSNAAASTRSAARPASSRCTDAIERMRDAGVVEGLAVVASSGRPSRSRSATVWRLFLIRWFASVASARSSSARAGGVLVGGSFATDRSREDERDRDGGRDEREPHRGRAGRERNERDRERAGRRADGEPEGAPPTALHDGDERDREEEEQREVRASGEDEYRDEADQPTRPDVEQEPAAANRQPLAPRNEHRGRIAAGGRERQPRAGARGVSSRGQARGRRARRRSRATRSRSRAAAHERGMRARRARRRTPNGAMIERGLEATAARTAPRCDSASSAAGTTLSTRPATRTRADLVRSHGRRRTGCLGPASFVARRS